MFYVIWFEAWPFWYLIDKNDQCSLVVTWTLFSICERLDNEEIHGHLTLRFGKQLHDICLMHHIFLICMKFLCCVSFFLFLHLCCLKRTCTFGSSSRFASNSMQVWWSTWPYKMFVFFSSIVKIIWQMMLYCYQKKSMFYVFLPSST
jgi:hypothetical protein